MSFARIKTALAQNAGTVIKYGIIGGGAAGIFSAAPGALIGSFKDFVEKCYLIKEMAPAYNCTVSLIRITRGAYACHADCVPEENSRQLWSDAAPRFHHSTWPTTAAYSFAIGFGAGFVAGAAYGVFRVIKDSNASLVRPLLEIEVEGVTENNSSARVSQLGVFANQVATNTSEHPVVEDTRVSVLAR